MKKKHILTLCFGLLACLYLVLVAVAVHTNDLLPRAIACGVWVAVVFLIAATLSVFCRKETFSLSWYDYSVITVGALACTLISGYFTATAEFDTLFEFFDVLPDTVPTLSLGVCFGFWWLVGKIKRHKNQSDRALGGETK